MKTRYIIKNNNFRYLSKLSQLSNIWDVDKNRAIRFKKKSSAKYVIRGLSDQVDYYIVKVRKRTYKFVEIIETCEVNNEI
jgi:hypothetical protein